MEVVILWGNYLIEKLERKIMIIQKVRKVTEGFKCSNSSHKESDLLGGREKDEEWERKKREWKIETVRERRVSEIEKERPMLKEQRRPGEVKNNQGKYS